MREELLKIIEKNSRIDLKELAVILGVEEIDVVNEMAAMEAEGIICGYHTLIDWEKTSIEKVSALIEVRVTPQRGQGFDSIAERIYKYPEVHAVYLISGGFDLLLDGGDHPAPDEGFKYKFPQQPERGFCVCFG